MSLRLVTGTRAQIGSVLPQPGTKPGPGPSDSDGLSPSQARPVADRPAGSGSAPSVLANPPLDTRYIPLSQLLADCIMALAAPQAQAGLVQVAPRPGTDPATTDRRTSQYPTSANRLTFRGHPVHPLPLPLPLTLRRTTFRFLALTMAPGFGLVGASHDGGS